MQRHLLVAGYIGLTAMAAEFPSLYAQSQPVPASGSNASICSEERMLRVENLPSFTLIRRETLVRKLPDGSVVRRERLTKEARDSQGRNYTEYRIRSVSNPDDPMLDHIGAHVMDPVSNASIGWDEEKQEATITHFERHDAQPRPQPAAPGVRGRVFLSSVITRGGVPITTEHRDEDLGMKIVSGTQACGSRDTETIPAGAEMNDKPVTVVRESWFSPELGIQVLAITDDSRFGVSTREILGLDRSEPDPALFRVPAGYTVRETTIKPPQFKP